MDNLAHSLVASMVGTAAMPSLAKRHPWRFYASSLLVVNFPDWDIILAFINKNTYHFHHRGFTHSFFGLLFIIPLCFLIHYFLVGQDKYLYAEDPQDWEYKRGYHWGLVCVQILFSHFFLDWLTSYGVMFFYPFSYTRMSFPLMFIIDPFLWFIGLGGMGFVLWGIKQNYCIKTLRTYALLGLSAVGLLWTGELASKIYTQKLYTQKIKDHLSIPETIPDIPSKKLLSFPSPFAPYVWSMLEIDQENSRWFRQGIATVSGKYILMTPSEGYITKEDCSPPLPRENLQSYRMWAEYPDCSRREVEGAFGCFCSSLKYSFPYEEFNTFGAYFWQDGASEGHFIIPPKKKRLWEKSLEIYKHLLF